MGIVEIEKDGKLYKAEYFLDENIVTVNGDSDFESTQLGGLSEEQVAKMLLAVLLAKAISSQAVLLRPNFFMSNPALKPTRILRSA